MLLQKMGRRAIGLLCQGSFLEMARTKQPSDAISRDILSLPQGIRGTEGWWGWVVLGELQCSQAPGEQLEGSGKGQGDVLCVQLLALLQGDSGACWGQGEARKLMGQELRVSRRCTAGAPWVPCCQEEVAVQSLSGLCVAARCLRRCLPGQVPSMGKGTDASGQHSRARGGAGSW